MGEENTNFDDKINYRTGNFALQFINSDGGFISDFSKNNSLTKKYYNSSGVSSGVSTYNYQYNDKNFPNQITNSYNSASGAKGSETYSLEYSCK